MKLKSKTIAKISLLISIIAVPLSAVLSFHYAKKSFKYETIEMHSQTLISAKDRFLGDLELFGIYAKSIAQMEFDTDISGKAQVEDYNTFYQKLYDRGLVNTLYLDIEKLNSNDFDLFLKDYDDKMWDAYITFALSRNNHDIAENKKAHLVYQILFESSYYTNLKNIDNNKIREFIKAKLKN
jgi:hypothetical protein